MKVAIVGTGISGVTLALRQQQLGVDVVDTPLGFCGRVDAPVQAVDLRLPLSRLLVTWLPATGRTACANDGPGR